MICPIASSDFEISLRIMNGFVQIKQQTSPFEILSMARVITFSGPY
jgi:hypothetical protein